MSSYWYQQSGADGDVVLSTRIRMARNLPDFPFTAGLNGEQKKQIADRVKEAFDAADIPYDRLEMAGMQPFDALSMVERHLISPEFARCEAGSWLLLSKDQSVSVMLGEEDHLRIQLMGAGMQPEQVFARTDALDTLLDGRLGFAFDDRLGYLTQCPTNLGTGMRASLMLHLPALQQRKAVEQLANTVSKLGMTIRGLYGEGSQPEGAIFQLSNQVTLGISETAAIENLRVIAAQIIEEERRSRTEALKNPVFTDRIWRSYGVLREARLLPHEEFMLLISWLRLGVAAGIIEKYTLDDISRLIHDCGAAALMSAAGRAMEPGERDTLRADLVRGQLTVDS